LSGHRDAECQFRLWQQGSIWNERNCGVILPFKPPRSAAHPGSRFYRRRFIAWLKINFIGAFKAISDPVGGSLASKAGGSNAGSGVAVAAACTAAGVGFAPKIPGIEQARLIAASSSGSSFSQRRLQREEWDEVINHS
jgi:hypothetical protein